MAQLVESANQRLYDMMQTAPSLAFMGSTVAGVLFGPGEMTIFNVGDSRVYLHAGGYLLQASRDHSSPRGELVQSLGGLDTYVPVETHMTTEPLGEVGAKPQYPRSQPRSNKAAKPLFEHSAMPSVPVVTPSLV